MRRLSIFVAALALGGCVFDLDAVREPSVDGGADAAPMDGGDRHDAGGSDGGPDAGADTGTGDAGPGASDAGVDQCVPPATPPVAPVPSFVWCHAGGGGGTQIARDLVARGNELFLTGFYQGGTNFGAGPLPTPGGGELLRWSIDRGDRSIVSDGYGGPGDDRGEKIAIDASGNTYLTGFITGPVDLGDGVVMAPAPGDTDLFLASYGPTGGVRWTRAFGDANRDWGTALTVTTAGEVIVAGRFQGTTNLGGGTLTSDNGDVFVAAFDADGAHLRSASYGGRGQDFPNDLAPDAAGGFAITGAFSAEMSLGGAELPHAGSEDVFVARYDATGNHVWSRSFGGTGRDRAYGVAVDACDRTLVTGYFHDTVSFGGGALASAGESDVFLASLDAAGNHEWSVRFGGAGRDEARDLTVDAQGNIYVVGYFADDAIFGASDMRTAAGGYDAFVVSYDRWGNYRWVRTFGGEMGLNFDVAYAVTNTPDGHVAVYGTVAGNTADIGCEVWDATGTDLFISVIDDDP